ncbi:uncharacterized protein LOC127246168 [Andrographis paniculata]|uniref:uncharacterized protein LOC127246168 n=1 Tax=Andrographis paniculata TaxID=175694 RepID=UPI0021E86450|nr:uncharacterized protein LOC127246168 [Andrographis paniculata]
MSVVGSLPNLEFLMLWYTAEGTEWNPAEGEFLRLKVLFIWGSDLVQWRADQNHYPRLETLALFNLPTLEEIPSGVGDIPTLREICLANCSKSAVDSAYLIIEEQQSIGNDLLKIEVSDTAENEDEDTDDDEDEDTEKDQDQGDDSEVEEKKKMKMMSLPDGLMAEEDDDDDER